MTGFDDFKPKNDYSGALAARLAERQNLLRISSGGKKPIEDSLCLRVHGEDCMRVVSVHSNTTADQTNSGKDARMKKS
jgi:hypothetical protein